MHGTKLIIATAAATFGLTLATATAAGASASDDQAAAQAAVDAYTTAITDAGFTSDGPGDPAIVDLAPTPTDSGAEQDPIDAAVNACLEPVAADGTFTGETARAVADNFFLEGETQSTDILAIGDSDRFSAVVAFVDDVDPFASGTLLDCLEEAPQPTDGPTTQIEYNVEAPDIGDQAAIIDTLTTTTIDGTDFTYRSQLGIAQVGRAVALVSYDGGADPVGDFTTADALEVLVGALPS